MKQIFKQFVQEEHGAPAVEYALILGLVSIAAAVGMIALGQGVQTWYTNLANYVSGFQLPQ